MKKHLLVLTFLVCALLIAGPANAISLGFNDLIGNVAPGTPANLTEEAIRAGHIIDLYNVGAGGEFVPSTGPGVPDYTYFIVGGENVPLPIIPSILGTGVELPLGNPTPGAAYTYVLAKLGQDDYLYYLGNDMTPISIVDPVGQGLGLSHLTLFNPTSVPEPGTLMLLGLGLVGVVAVRRFRKR